MSRNGSVYMKHIFIAFSKVQSASATSKNGFVFKSESKFDKIINISKYIIIFIS